MTGSDAAAGPSASSDLSGRQFGPSSETERMEVKLRFHTVGQASNVPRAAPLAGGACV